MGIRIELNQTEANLLRVLLSGYVEQMGAEEQRLAGNRPVALACGTLKIVAQDIESRIAKDMPRFTERGE